MRPLEGRRALVTGAAQGIGRATAALLAQAGAAVHIADIDRAGIEAAGEALGLPAHACDLSERAAAGALVAQVEEAGGCDILVNAAGGVVGQVGRPLDEVREADWQAIFRANVEGTLWLSQAVAPGMTARGYGRLVNIASGAGLRPTLTGIQAYTAAKHALVGLTKQLSQELAPSGITVNAVAPGLILSNPSSRAQWEAYGEAGQRRILEATHTRRLGTPEDIARAVAFLAEEAAGWITGQILSVDGGRS